MRTWLQASAQPLSSAHDVALLDLDGVVYIGADAVPGAAAALRSAREAGLRLAFVTNNAARPPQAVADHLTELGIAADPAEIITSAQAAARWLAERLPAGAPVLVIGTTGLVEALRERGLTAVSDANGDVAAVVQGFSPDLDWKLLAEGCLGINRGVPWVATNVDPTVPSPRGRLPGNGSLVAALRHATRKEPVVTGKPDPTMHRESVLRSGAKRPIVVGDRLDTDIEGANEVGCPSLLVFSGVTDVADLLAAEPRLRPTFLAADVGGLCDVHPAPAIEADGARCGAWVSRADGVGLDLRRSPEAGRAAGESTDSRFDDDALNAIRALCAARWTSVDARGAGNGEAAGAAPVSGSAGQLSVRGLDPAAKEMVQRLGLD
ncbi:HAD-IIA family hydrolase [uncultured Jatrophihabitans sp.]|uniref:HAD-IIA family hydrolase n=1 Tax=uncultured Jatrophihabitans sp. TaxID=1610747 RepID=UPI0035CB6FE5